MFLYPRTCAIVRIHLWWRVTRLLGWWRTGLSVGMRAGLEYVRAWVVVRGLGRWCAGLGGASFSRLCTGLDGASLLGWDTGFISAGSGVGRGCCGDARLSGTYNSVARCRLGWSKPVWFAHGCLRSIQWGNLAWVAYAWLGRCCFGVG